MIVSPSNIIEGLFNIVIANRESIDAVVKSYDRNATLHMFKGIRKTAPLSMFPCLEIEPVSGSMDWHTTSSETCEYTVDCVLTVKCGANIESGVEYISSLVRRLMELFNYPGNMTWAIPNEFADREGKAPIYCQYSDVRSVDYMSTKDFSVRVARWQMTCRTVEPFPHPVQGLAPQSVDWRKTTV